MHLPLHLLESDHSPDEPINRALDSVSAENRDIGLHSPPAERRSIGELLEDHQLSEMGCNAKLRGLIGQKSRKLRNRVQLDVIDQQIAALLHHGIDVEKIDYHHGKAVAAVDQREIKLRMILRRG